MKTQMEKIAGGLKGSKDDLTGALLAGTFRQSEKKVLGYWPIGKALIENLAGGI
jgi:hypothetical protein